MSYAVKEIFYTLQGEGANTGRPAVFCRFAGCNLWSGHEPDRATAVCRFCDTDFVGIDGAGGGGVVSPRPRHSRRPSRPPGRRAKPRRASSCAPAANRCCSSTRRSSNRCTRKASRSPIETNGTQPGLDGIDWVCVSPKAGAELVLRQGNELKLIYPQAGIDPESLQALPFTHFFLQPMDGPDRLRNTQLAVQYCLEHPRWRLSLQTHKLLGIP